jgi:hypothetical protein
VEFSNRQTAQTDTTKSLHIFARILENYGQSIAARTLRSKSHRVAEDAEATEAELTSILAAIKEIC